jgi:hypothetical protein
MPLTALSVPSRAKYCKENAVIGVGTLAAKVVWVRACLFLSWCWFVAVTACSANPAHAGDAGRPQASVADADAVLASAEIGVPGGVDGLDFAPLEPGAEIRLQTLGQGGTHVFLAVRTLGFGNRAFVTLTLRNLNTGKEIKSPAPPRPQLLFCDDAHFVCDLVPLTVMTGGITDSGEERDGLHIAIEAEVHNEAGVQAHAENEAVLSTADL